MKNADVGDERKTTQADLDQRARAAVEGKVPPAQDEEEVGRTTVTERVSIEEEGGAGRRSPGGGLDSLERAGQRSDQVALFGTISTSILLLIAVGLTFYNLRGPVVALIAAGVTAGIATLSSCSGARAAQLVAARRYQLEMVNQIERFYGAQPATGGAYDSQLNQLVSKSVEEMARLPQKEDGRDGRLASEWLDSTKQLWKQADDNHTRLASERLELLKAIVTPVEGPGTGK